MTIMRGRLVFEFLFNTNEVSEDRVRLMSIGEIVEECDAGDFMGHQVSGTYEVVPDAEVPAAEMAYGGDGTFFADPDELEHARLDAEAGRPDRDCDPDCSRRFSPAAECDCSRSD